MSLVHDLVKAFIGSEMGKIYLTSYCLPKEIGNRVSHSPVVIRQEYPVGDGFIDVVWHDYENEWVIAFEIKVGGTPAEFISQIDRYYEWLSTRFKDVTIVGVVPSSIINEIKAKLPEHLAGKVVLIKFEPLSLSAFEHLVGEVWKTYKKYGFSIDWYTYSHIMDRLQEVLSGKRSSEEADKLVRYIILDVVNVSSPAPFGEKAGTAILINKKGELRRRYLDRASMNMLEECRGVFEVTGTDLKNNYFSIRDAKCLSIESIEEEIGEVLQGLTKRRVVVVDEKHGIDVETGLRVYFNSLRWSILAPKLIGHEVEFLAVNLETRESSRGNKYIQAVGFIPVNIKKRPELSEISSALSQEFKGTVTIIDSIEVYETVIKRDIGEKIEVDLIFLGTHEGYYPVVISSSTEEVVKQILDYLDKGYLVEVELVKYAGAVSYIPKEIKKVYSINEYLQNGGQAVRGRARLMRHPVSITVEAEDTAIDFGAEYHVADFDGSVIPPITRNAKRLISTLKTNNGVADIVAVVSKILSQKHVGRKDKIIGIQFNILD